MMENYTADTNTEFSSSTAKSTLLFQEPKWAVNLFYTLLWIGFMLNITHGFLLRRMKFEQKHGGKHFRLFLQMMMATDLVMTGSCMAKRAGQIFVFHQLVLSTMCAGQHHRSRLEVSQPKQLCLYTTC